MIKFLIHTFCFSLLLTCSICLYAQENPTVKSAIDRNEILIGEPIRLSLDVKSPLVSGNGLPQFDSIPHFELIEKGSLDSTISAEGAAYHLEWKITSFDSGTRFIPSFSVTIGNQIYKTDSLAVEVSYGNVDTSKDYHDIKGIIDLENPSVKYIPWIVAALTLVALILFVWFIRKRLPVNLEPVSVKRAGANPVDDAMASLDALKNMIREDPAAVKKYYSGMNDTLRVFLNRKMGFITMEKTSEELIHTISDLNMEREAFSKLSAALRMGDFVKFAKYIPGPFEIENNLEEVRKGIILINENAK